MLLNLDQYYWILIFGKDKKCVVQLIQRSRQVPLAKVGNS